MTPDISGPESSRIQNMFGSIAPGYDRANTILSGGIHRLWKKRLITRSGARPGDAVLDCATGTGDLAFAFAQVTGAEGEVVGTDFCTEMLDVARAKLARRPQPGLRFDTADVTKLPYPASNFDVSSISFGIRNVQDPVQGLSELARVVKPGGRVMVLEFGQPPAGAFRQLYDFYSRRVLPRIGAWITGQKDAYQYLEESAAKFPCREEFVALMTSTGRFASVEFEALTGGIAYLYTGIVK